MDQGLPYYERFIAAFPTVQELAAASEDEVMKLWEGLGYYSRARNLHATAKVVAETYEGEFPSSYKSLLALKGIGPYTAAAIGSIAFNLPVAAVDGNVYRVLARFAGIVDSIDEAFTKKRIAVLAQSFLGVYNSGDHNQAMMELGATVCTPQKPNCYACPLQSDCIAFAQGCQIELPVRTKKNKVKNRYFYYAMYLLDSQTAISKRKEGDIWQGLYEFPLVETSGQLNEDEIPELFKLNSNDTVISISQELKHVLSHQQIYSRFVLIRSVSKPKGHYKWISVADLRNFAFPRLINRYLEGTSFVIDE